LNGSADPVSRILDILRSALARLPFPLRPLVAYSGGVDSHVLLHALTRLRREAALPPPLAAHVHHGLQTAADDWVEHCRQVCAALAVPLQVVHVDARSQTGESPEATARRARYAALADALERGACLLTAHQRDDQAETLLLQLLRGAGPAGLAAMPPLAPFGNGWHLRPLLDVSRDDLLAYARAEGLVWVEDPSNRDVRHDRNHLRLNVLPALRARWPSAARTLARAARHQAEAARLLDDLARIDLETARGSDPSLLSVAALQRLPPPRQRNALRGWLADKGLPPPPEARLNAVLDDVLTASVDAMPRVWWQGAEIRRYRDDLYAFAPLPPHDPSTVLAWPAAQETLELAWLGLNLTRDALSRQGLSWADAELELHFRQGGETCRVRGHRRDLRKLMQEAGVPPWQRERIPLVYCKGELVWVVGLCRCEAAAGE
jgi:tRNA(Ile)-lysidine synthase